MGLKENPSFWDLDFAPGQKICSQFLFRIQCSRTLGYFSKMPRVILDEPSVLFQWPNSFLPQNILIKENVALIYIFLVKALISERNLNNVSRTGAVLFCTFPSYVSCMVGCPYEGFIEPKAVAGVSI